jgi:hypothetical protein
VSLKGCCTTRCSEVGLGSTAWSLSIPVAGNFSSRSTSRIRASLPFTRATLLRNYGTRPRQTHRTIAEDADVHRLLSRSARRRAQSRLVRSAQQPRSPSQSHWMKTAPLPRRRRTNSRSSTRPSSPRSKSRPPSRRSGDGQTRSLSQTSSR